MYNPNIYNTAVGMASMAFNNGFEIKARANSPLELIFREMTVDEATVLSTQSYVENLEHVNGLANTVIPSDGSLVGDKMFAWLEQNYIEPLKAQVAFTRNNVLPLVRQTVVAVREQILSKLEGISNVNIVSLEIPSVLTNSLLASKFEGQKPVRQTTFPDFKPAFAQEIVEQAVKSDYLTSDEFQIDSEQFAQAQSQYADLALLADEHYTGDLIHDAIAVFLVPSNQNIIEARVSHLNMYRAVMAIAIISAVARRPFVGVGTGSEDLIRWSGWLCGVMAYYVCSHLNYINGMVASNQIVVNVKKRERTITVLGDNYRNWMEHDTDNDVEDHTDLLIGILNNSGESNHFTLNQIQENKEQLLRAARVFSTVEKAKLNDRKAMVILNGIKDTAREVYVQATSDAESVYASFVEPYKTVNQVLFKVGEVFEAQFGNKAVATETDHIIATVLCKVFFGSTMALDIISEMEEAFDANLEVDEHDKEAIAGIALTSVVNKWLLSQIEFVPVAGSRV